MWELGVNLFERYYGSYTEDLRPFVETMLNKRIVAKVNVERTVSWDHRKLGPPLHPPGLIRSSPGTRATPRSEPAMPPPHERRRAARLPHAEPAHTAKLATVRADGRPHVAPVWFVLDPRPPGPAHPIGDIVFNTGADTLKGKALRRDPRVACASTTSARPSPSSPSRGWPP